MNEQTTTATEAAMQTTEAAGALTAEYAMEAALENLGRARMWADRAEAGGSSRVSVADLRWWAEEAVANAAWWLEIAGMRAQCGAA